MPRRHQRLPPRGVPLTVGIECLLLFFFGIMFFVFLKAVGLDDVQVI